jgi:hypothetical protein
MDERQVKRRVDAATPAVGAALEATMVTALKATAASELKTVVQPPAIGL